MTRKNFKDGLIALVVIVLLSGLALYSVVQTSAVRVVLE